jgi:hypothetical protein
MESIRNLGPVRCIPGLVLFVVLLVAACGRSDANDPVASDKRGREVVQAMSDLLAGAQVLTFSTDVARERVSPEGGLDTLRSSSKVAIRRPDGYWWHNTGPNRDIEGWYDGDSLTVVANGKKLWAAVAMPPTIDETLDEMAIEYDIPVAMGDMLYSSPYDALFAGENKGGWKGTEEINGQTCDHVAYESELVNWELWVSDGDQALPCRLLITYNQEPGPPRVRITFSDGNLAAELPEDQFAARIPEGYDRIAVIGRASGGEEVDQTETTNQPADTTQP